MRGKGYIERVIMSVKGDETLNKSRRNGWKKWECVGGPVQHCGQRRIIQGYWHCLLPNYSRLHVWGLLETDWGLKMIIHSRVCVRERDRDSEYLMDKK